MTTGICKKCGSTCEILFRWTRTIPETGVVIRSHTRPFPIPVCSCTQRKN